MTIYDNILPLYKTAYGLQRSKVYAKSVMCSCVARIVPKYSWHSFCYETLLYATHTDPIMKHNNAKVRRTQDKATGNGLTFPSCNGVRSEVLVRRESMNLELSQDSSW
jgi:hypothetical protein